MKNCLDKKHLCVGNAIRVFVGEDKNPAKKTVLTGYITYIDDHHLIFHYYGYGDGNFWRFDSNPKTFENRHEGPWYHKYKDSETMKPMDAPVDIEKISSDKVDSHKNRF